MPGWRYMVTVSKKLKYEVEADSQEEARAIALVVARGGANTRTLALVQCGRPEVKVESCCEPLQAADHPAA
jgi:hypothetical protein